MTNLSPDRPAWRHQITRERALVIVPAVLGLTLAAGVFAAVGWPAFDRVDHQRQRIAVLHSKRDSLPLLEAQLKRSETSLSEAMQQQALIVDLVAGRGQIQTFLAQLSRISAASGVLINLYEPVPVSSSEASNRSGTKDRRKKRAVTAQASNDPFQTLGYRKSSVLLQVEGPYQGLLKFLREMEQLKLLVQPSDLELTALENPANTSDQAVTSGSPRTRLKLKLTFFDQASNPVNGATSSSGSTEMKAKGDPPS